MTVDEDLLSDPWPATSLRERKRLRAMRRVQTIALDLFDQHGFDEVTIERIAAEAELSPSTVYRYFGSKEQLVIWDEYDPMALQAIIDELADRPPLEAVRHVVFTLMRSLFEHDQERVRRRLRLAYTYPSIEAASALQAYEMARLIAEILARQLDRESDELDIQVFAHAFAGGIAGALRHWWASDFRTPFEQVIDRPLAALERGLDLT